MAVDDITDDDTRNPDGNIALNINAKIGLNVPNGYMGRAIQRILQQKKTQKLLLILSDDMAMQRMAQQLEFWQFKQTKDYVLLPAWDCLPYDRVSPHYHLIAARLAALATIKQAQPSIIIASVNGFVQKMIGTEQLKHHHLKIGNFIARTQLLQLLNDFGYLRAVTVRENCEYAVRGDIIDIFPTDAIKPVRIEFFDEQIEMMRHFDVMNQRTDKESIVKEMTVMSGSETPIGQGDIFKRNYLQLFGRMGDEYLLEAVKNDLPYQGKEHWLPLFFDTPLIDMLGWIASDTMLVIGDDFYPAMQSRLEMIDEHYQERKSKMPQSNAVLRKMREENQYPYAPVPPDMLYLNADNLRARMNAFDVIQLSAAKENLPNQPVFYDFAARKGIDYRQDFLKGEFPEILRNLITKTVKKKQQIIIGCFSEGSRIRLSEMFSTIGLLSIPQYDATVTAGVAVLEGNSFEDESLLFISETDILGQRVRKNHRKKKSVADMFTELNSLNQGDYVVHAEHGIARYEGITTIESNNIPYECLHLIYANRSALYLPVENIDLLTRYGNADMDNVKLDSLGLNHWQQRKARMKKHLLEIAGGLVETAAKRQLKIAPVIEYDKNLWEQFCAGFPFVETDDQAQVISDVTGDLQKGVPMDRLVCGDAGFGKTEIALRAAFQVASSGRQVILIVPTTLLARQHYQLFTERFKNFEIKIVQLSRFVTGAQSKENKQAITDGSAQIVIGTHQLLGNSIEFNHPGLLIIDEEQHFGVKQKEKLKQWSDLHILTLSATPIPRSLNFALSGLRDLSLIVTPPVDRLAVRSFITPYDSMIMAEAIKREILRGGQVFCVCPRISDLTRLEIQMRELAQNIRHDMSFGIAHGQMKADDLERMMQQFVDGRLDMLLSTNIVESGLDIPRANTIFIFRPDKFGLSQLYQLRGRVGRGTLRGYCYFILPRHAVTKQTMKRMEVMQSLESVGGGFQVASHDLDLRGGGNLLGEAQSGKISEIGVELYHQMLREALKKVKGEDENFADDYSPQVKLDMPVMIPEQYVEDLSLRMGLYQRLARLQSQSDIDDFAGELTDRFGEMPIETRNLLQVMKLRLLCRHVNVSKLEVGNKGLNISFRNHQFGNPEALLQWVMAKPHQISIDNGHRLVVRANMPDEAQRLKNATQLLRHLSKILDAK